MNYRYLLKVVLILIFSVPISGQTTFSKVHNIVNGNEYGSSVIILKDKYFICNRAVIDPLDQVSKYVNLISSVNLAGDIKEYYNFWEDTYIAPTKQFSLSNDTVYIFGQDTKVDSSLWKLFKFSPDGDSLGLFTIQFDSFIYASAGFNCGDYFYLGGGSSSSSFGEKLVLIKLDKNGRIIREVNMTDFANPVNANWFNDMIVSGDGFLVLTIYFFDVVLKTHNVGICKLNKDLDIVWKKYILDVGDDININPYITSTPDSGFVLNVGIDFSDSITFSNPQYKNYGDWPTVIYKIDTDGNTVWTDTMFTFRGPNFEPAPYNETYSLTTAANGDIIGVGTYNHPIKKPGKFGWMFRYSPDGRKKWEHYYYDEKYSGRSWFFDVEEAANGDIVCTGGIDDRKNGEWNNSVYTWLLRVDSMGCLVPGCYTGDTLTEILTTATDEIIINISGKIAIYPNPANDVINISVPEGFEAEEVEVFDVLGNQLMKIRSDIKELDVKYLKSGLYIVIVSDKSGRFVTGKFVKR